MTHHGSVFVCIKHRYAGHWGVCPTCGHSDTTMSAKWRAPKKTNDRAWKQIAKGNYLWDKAAVAKRATRWNESMDAYWEKLKRRNPKMKYPFHRM